MTKLARIMGLVALAGTMAGAPRAEAQAAWTDRADAALRQWFRGPNGVALAQSVQRITHPTGSDANLARYEMRHIGDTLSVLLHVTWVGGLGGSHTTVVAWDFDRRGHKSAAVLRDDAVTSVSGSAARKLNVCFQDEIYPTLHDAVGD